MMFIINIVVKLCKELAYETIVEINMYTYKVVH